MITFCFLFYFELCIFVFSGGESIKDNQIQNCVTYAKKRAKTIHELIKKAAN